MAAVTAPERPAGRPVCGARPAGARSRPWVTDPAVIRRALAWRAGHTLEATAARAGVRVSTVVRWQAEVRAHAPAVWPSDADIAAFAAGRAHRAHEQLVRNRWEWRRRTGPLLVDSTGTQRRLRALAAVGWRYADIADEVGASRTRIGHLAVGLFPTVHRDTAAAIADVYDRLSMTAGPSDRSRAVAAGRGWPPPLAWDDETIDDPAARPDRGHRELAAFDEVAVARAMHGDRVHLRPIERAEAVRRLTDAGWSARAIAARLHTTPRSVQRHRTAQPDPARRTA